MPQDQTLAQRVRAKYPGAYDDMDDVQLESAVLAKFPGVYDDIPKTTAGAAPSATTGMPTQSTGAEAAPTSAGSGDWAAAMQRRAAGLVGDVALGAVKGAAGTAIGLGELAHKVPGVSRAVDALYGQPGLSARAFPAAREAVAPTNTAQQVGRFAEQTAEMMVPAAKVASVTKGAGLVAQMAAQGATGAAVTGAQTGGDHEDMLASALLMGATPAVAKAASTIGRGLTERLPERLYTQIFKHAHDDVAQAFRAEAGGAAPNPTLAKEAVEKGLMGSTRNMAVYSAKKLDTLETQLQREAGKRIMVLPKKAEFVGLLDDIERQFSKGFFSERGKEAAALKSALTTMPGPSARATDMLKVKRFLDGLRTSSSFRLDPNLAPKQEELKIAADMVRAKLHTVPAMSQLIQDERVFIQAFEALVDDAVRTGNRKLLGLTDVMLGGGGLASGVPGAGLGAMAAVRAGQTPRILTGLGQALYRTGAAIPSGAAEVGARGAAAAVAEGVR